MTSKFRYRYFLRIALLLLTFLSPFINNTIPVFAECGKGCVETAILGDENHCVCDTEDGFGLRAPLDLALEILSIGVGVLGAIGIIMVSIQYITAGGDESKTRKAKRRMLEIVVGLALWFTSFGIMNWLSVPLPTEWAKRDPSSTLENPANSSPSTSSSTSSSESSTPPTPAPTQTTAPRQDVPSSEKTVFSEKTDSLQVTISKRKSHYVSRIWIRDPYTQLGKVDSPEYGKTLYRPGELLKKTVSKNNLQDKLVIGFNASGFYLKDTYDSSSVKKYPAYNKTSVGTLVITDGKVVRNAYDHADKTWFTTGIDRNGQLRIFEDRKSSNANEKYAWSQTVISSGIRNTFTFASPLVENGVESKVTTSMPGKDSRLQRQAICQIDKNNLILITGSNLSRSDLIKEMLEFGCKTGTNLDGGGSIALLVKSKDSKDFKVITGNGRALTEAGYIAQF